MDKVRVSLVIQSMLSDAMVEVHHPELMEEGQGTFTFCKVFGSPLPKHKPRYYG